MNSTIRVLITASGTGGHLMPALAVMKELQNRGVEVRFAGSGRPLEEEIIGGAGFHCVTIPSVGLKNKGIRGFLKFLVGIPGAFGATSAIFQDFKPQAVVGIGGYATFFPLLLARLKGIPSWIHESEISPGLANKVLSFIAQRISTAFEETVFPLCSSKIVYTGQPVRAELSRIAGESRKVTNPQRLLILGGSQGATALDEVFLELAPVLKKHDLQVWHQSRPMNVERLTERYDELEIPHKVMSFIEHMDEAYRWSHLIVSRAGAGAVMEIGTVNRPALFVPYPHAQGDHQAKNAAVLVGQGKAYMEREGEKFSERIHAALEKLLNPEQYNKMRLRAASARPVDAAQKISDEVLALIS